MSWIRDTSFLMECVKNENIKIEINSSNYFMSFNLLNGKYNLSLFSSHDIRISYDGNRLIDMHNLRVLKDNEARVHISNMIRNIKVNMSNEINNLAIMYNIPVKILYENLEAIFNLDFSLLSCLDYGLDYFLLHLTNNFAKQSSQFEVVKKLKFILGNERGCIKAILSLSNTYESDSFLFSSDCINFQTDVNAFSKFLRDYRTLNVKYIEVIDYLKQRLPH
ncbi:hypothetical protein SULI_00125 [Saccharolobus solfataricus]|nr:hypothetical protein [Saccharolobus solfataricus]AKA72480.1 hypothetical protein SULB_0025 [Saccharolobus solfataricus]AKA75180.1 hypothetical protein SULC_0024 [Saccharolobus solfataricus]AKA77873.1 hypothetical protein SULA_0024 [Saccharolobus solfataricus]AZF66994.1 hypothetical protein SULG_00125 [Saccharolobus solfataricus]AZF69614.1 hypothetical protein SULH_00125 [Saccharolobus solfataricus]